MNFELVDAIESACTAGASFFDLSIFLYFTLISLPALSIR